tara:strand:+ start:292 stop:513 length:222 start_codon:yes stop_codon:yes gene_type:complete
MVKFKVSFGRVFRLPNKTKLSKNYLKKCKKGQPKFKPNNNSKKNNSNKKTKKGWWIKVNNRAKIKKQKKAQCY